MLMTNNSDPITIEKSNRRIIKIKMTDELIDNKTLLHNLINEMYENKQEKIYRPEFL